MIKKLILFSLGALLAHAAETAPNLLTPDETQAGWRLLWDGRTSTGWRSPRRETFPAKGWQMEDGILFVRRSDGSEGGVGGDIVTVEKFANFELSVDFKLSPGANSGIKYYVNAELNKGAGSAIGLEYQLLDDERHPDAQAGKNGNRTVASLYDLYPAAATKPIHPPGEWNTARIVSRGAHVEHWLNGVKVVEYDRFTDRFRQDVSESKYQVWPGFGELPEGHILLQDHGDEVYFRNIKIRVLTASGPNP
jgi:hypothetical protein